MNTNQEQVDSQDDPLEASIAELLLLRRFCYLQDLLKELTNVKQLEDLYRGAVQGVLSKLGFDRAFLTIYDATTQENRGTWGTNLSGELVNESHLHGFVGSGEALAQEALAEPNNIKVLEIDDQNWKIWVALLDGSRLLGWLSIDNALRNRPLRVGDREILSMYARTLGLLMHRFQNQSILKKYSDQNTMKDRLFTILAHDLRGPVGSLSELLSWASEENLPAEELREFLVEGQKSASRTYGLLENVLGWVRSQIEEVSVLRERIPLGRPLESVRSWLESMADQKNITLHILCPDSFSVMTDERMVETILRNLVSNAIKFSPRGSTVILCGRMESEGVYLEVSDQGIGMSGEMLTDLMSFTSSQAKIRAGTAGEGGSGLGLKFSADLAQCLGGRLEAHSVPAEGSVFRLILPDELDGELQEV